METNPISKLNQLLAREARVLRRNAGTGRPVAALTGGHAGRGITAAPELLPLRNQVLVRRGRRAQLLAAVVRGKAFHVVFRQVRHHAAHDVARARRLLPGLRLEVVQLLAEGRTNKEVARRLGITVKTAETHRNNIMRKMGFESLADLVRYAVRNRIVDA